MPRARLSLAVTLLAIAGLNAVPAQAQPTRVFVAAQGSDSNPCTFAAPCRTFQKAHNTVAADGEIDVLDPAGYGAVTITKSIGIQGHGFSGVSVTGGVTAITITTGTASTRVSLRGLLLDGVGVGNHGITINSAGRVDVQECAIRNFTGNGINFQSSVGGTLAVLNSYITSNSGSGILFQPTASGTAVVSGSYLTANSNNAIYFNGTSTLTGVIDGAVLEASSTLGGLRIGAPGAYTVSDSVIANNFD